MNAPVFPPPAQWVRTPRRVKSPQQPSMASYAYAGAGPTRPPSIGDIAGLTAALDARVLVAGDTMTGLLTLSGAPTADLHAATRKFVLDNITAGGGYTDEQAQDACAALIQDGPGITWAYDDVLNTLTPTVTGGGGATDWADITGKPSSFPPSTHTHAIADTTGLQSVLDAKADDSDLAGKANTTHTHIISDTTGLQTALDGKADDSDLASKANTVHTHAIADTTGLQTALDGKVDDAELTTITLDSLSDVDTTGVASGKLLRYNGTSWEDGVGITDSATGARLVLTNALLTYGAAGGQAFDFVQATDATAGSFSGGIAANVGGNIVCYGSTHATLASNILHPPRGCEPDRHHLDGR